MSVETSSLWPYMFWSVVPISIQGASGPRVYAVSRIGDTSTFSLHSVCIIHICVYIYV
jgi:hypothetical protein